MSTTRERRTSTQPALHRRTRTAVLGTVIASAALTGCTIDFSAIPAAAVGALIPFNACDEALDYLQREAAARVGPYGLEQGAIAWSGSVEDSASDGSALAAVPTSPGSSEYSSTNNQEVGVDEADMVKTDGEYIYTVVDGTLRVTDVRDGEPEVVGKLEIATAPAGGADGQAYSDMMWGYAPAQLLLEGETALVLMTQPSYGIDDKRIPSPGFEYGWSQSIVVAVDLTDPTAPRETARLAVDGDYLSARMIDGTARIVVRSNPRLPFESPYSEDPEADWGDLESDSAERNRQIVAESTIDQWLPAFTLDVDGEETSGQLVACEDVSHPIDFSGFTTVSVLTVPLDSAAALETPLTASVLGDGEIVYASTDRLYVVTNRWLDSGPTIFAPGTEALRAPSVGSTTTGIHAFDITGDGAARHVASGEVAGRVIGQYALSEHEGVLRVATTDGDMWASESSPSESKVTTLAEEAGDLVELGSVGGLGKGEQIYAVRYFGDTAYVVTFRQTDPLYVLDLADPANPRETGELKITGYSAYLHTLGEDRLIGVGQEATDDGRTVGLQVSLFDTSDPTSPTKIDGEVLRGAWSEAEWDPHAFLSWEPTGQVMVPVMGERQSGLLVLSVTDGGLVQDGLVPPMDDARIDSYTSPMRSVVVDDRLYTVWMNGIQGNELGSFDELGWAPFG